MKLEHTSTEQLLSVSLLCAGDTLQCCTHYHPYIEIGLVLTGTVTLQLYGETHTLQPGDLYTAAPDAIHSLTAFCEGTQLLRLYFSVDMIRTHPDHFFYRDFWEPLVRETLLLPAVIPAAHPANPALREQLLLIKESKDKVLCFAALMELCLQLMPYCSYRNRNTSGSAIHNEAVGLCMRYILNHYDRKFDLAQLAGYTKRHPNYLCAVFKQYTGQTIFEYLTKFRIETAAALLRKEALPVGKIARLVGFPSESLFYKKFRELMGTTPKSYQRQYRIRRTRSE